MEVFVLHQADEPPADGAVVAFVIVDRSVLERYWPSAESLDEAFPGLDVEDSDYRDGGPDQIRLWGWHDEIITALDDERFAVAARSLAEPHLRTTTVYSRYHNYQLADHVLGRA